MARLYKQNLQNDKGYFWRVERTGRTEKPWIR